MVGSETEAGVRAVAAADGQMSATYELRKGLSEQNGETKFMSNFLKMIPVAALAMSLGAQTTTTTARTNEKTGKTQTVVTTKDRDKSDGQTSTSKVFTDGQGRTATYDSTTVRNGDGTGTRTAVGTDRKGRQRTVNASKTTEGGTKTVTRRDGSTVNSTRTRSK